MEEQKPTRMKHFLSILFPRFSCLLLPAFTILSSLPLLAQPSGLAETNVRQGPSFVRFEPEEGLLSVFRDGRLAPIICSSDEYTGVEKVIAHLSADLERVTGQRPEVYDKLPGQPLPRAIIIGALGRSPLIDELAAAGKLPAKQLQGKREKFYITTVSNPLKNVEQALVIAGSDKRGTIYGIYEFCAQIGVSPWYWWADVPVVEQSYIGIRPGLFTDGEPKVKYRGIFINDEAPALAGWAYENFGGFNHRFYEKVYELILRLKGNYLWPAMWGRAIYDDDPLSPELADEYGVVIGASHHEPLMRAHVEWERYGEGAWDYSANAEVLGEFWREGIRRMGDNESIVTIGMRGDGDEPMSEESNIALLEKIVRDQRAIIAEVTGRPVEETPQLWALYKEVQEYYDKGMRVPDDVTLLLCDDNWGNIRKLPHPDAPPRPGGYGIYYHFDYVGGPRNYKWINTNNIARVWEQMHMAYEHGVKEVWIVNVGDIKPMELPTQFFLDMAWDPEVMAIDSMAAYSLRWAARQFGGYKPEEIAFLLDKYTKYNSRRKPELLNIPVYSLTQYDEARRVVAEYKALEKRAYRILENIPRACYDAYYQLVYFPIAAGANLNELYYAHNMNRWCAAQGRASANEWAEKVKTCFARDSLLTHYFHRQLADGKWNHMMSQTHIGYTYWQQPPHNTMPEVEYVRPDTNGALGVWLPRQPKPVQSDSFNFLPPLSPELQPSTFIELYNTGSTPITYAIHTGKPWVNIDGSSGKISSEKRIALSVDWDAVEGEEDEAVLTILSPENTMKKVYLKADKAVTPSGFEGYAERNGLISIKPEKGYSATNSEGAVWKEIPGFGRTGAGMKAFPPTRSIPPDQLSAASPRLSYSFFLKEGGSFDIELFLAPTIDFYNKGGLLTAISIDDGPPRILNIHDADNAYSWPRAVSGNVNVVRTRMDIPAGRHKLHLWHVDPGPVFEKVLIKRNGAEDETYLGPPATWVD